MTAWLMKTSDGRRRTSWSSKYWRQRRKERTAIEREAQEAASTEVDNETLLGKEVRSKNWPAYSGQKKSVGCLEPPEPEIAGRGAERRN